MKRIIVLCVGAGLLYGCSEETTASLKVLKKKSEQSLVSVAGEAEVTLELFKNQYAILKERLVRLKALYKIYGERLDEAYAAGNSRRIYLYEGQLKVLGKKIPEAEKALREFYTIYENQKQELYLLKEDTFIHQTMGKSILSGSSLYADAAERAERISVLTNRLKERSKTAQALVEVNEIEENFIQ